MTEPTDKTDDALLDDYLSGDSTLSAAYRAAADAAPAPALDAAILAAAQQQSPVRGRSRLLTLWEKPVSIAAAMLLCAGLVIYMQDAGDVAPFGQPDAAPQVAISETIDTPGAQSPRAAKTGTDDVVTDNASGDAFGRTSDNVSDDASAQLRPPPDSMAPAASDTTVSTTVKSETPNTPQSAVEDATRPSSGAPSTRIAPLTESHGRRAKQAGTDEQLQQRAASKGLLTTMPVSGLRSDAAKDAVEEANDNAEGVAREMATAPGTTMQRDVDRTEEAESIDEVIVTGNRRQAPPARDPSARRLATSSIATGSQLTPAQFANLAKEQPARALDQIAALWESGEHIMAEDRLEVFRSLYPDYSMRRLSETLPPELLGRE